MAYNTGFGSYAADRSGSSSSSGGGRQSSTGFGDYAATIKKRKEEEEANKNYAEELRQQQQKDAEAAEKKRQDEKSLGEKVGDVAGGFWDAATEAYKRTGEGLGEIAYDITGGNKRDQEAANKANEEDLKMIKSIGERMKNAKTPEEKDKWREQLSNISKSSDERYKARTQRTDEIIERTDPKKQAAAAAEIALDVVTAGTLKLATTGAKVAAKTAVKTGTKSALSAATRKVMTNVGGNSAKQFGKRAAGASALGGAYGVTGTVMQEGDDTTAEDIAKNVLLGATIGAAIPVAGKVGGKVLKATDNAASKAAAKAAEKVDDGAVQRSLKQIGEDGIVGTIDKALARGAQRTGYAVENALNKTSVGSKVVGMKDDFMGKWVSEFHPLYGALKKSDFEGRTEGAYLAAREAIGNSNRSLSYAQDFIESNANMQKITASLAARNKNVIKSREVFDEFAKVKSELDLAKNGKKKFSKKKMEELNGRMAKFEDNNFDEEYTGLVDFYKDLNKFRVDNGLISKEAADQFEKEGFDYIRQQRELPDWMLDKPAAKGRGSSASISGSGAIQKRSKYASAEQLSPMETAIKTAQMAHVEAYRNKAAKTVYGLLDDAGEARLVKSTEMVNEKRALLTGMKEGKKVANKLNRAIRTHKDQARDLKKEIQWLQKNGKNELSKNIRATLKDLNKKSAGTSLPMSERQMMDALVSLETPELRKLRRMIEGRNSKLEPLLDRLESLNGELSDVYGRQQGMWQQASSINTTVNKSNQTTMSFLDDGIENVVKIDPNIASAIHNWDKQSQNVMNEVLRFSNNVFKYGTTGANVGFALPNFVADQVSSAVNSKSILRTHNPKNFVHSLFMAMGKPLNERDAKIMQGYLKGNAQQTSINQYTKATKAKRAADKLVKSQGLDTSTGNIAKDIISAAKKAPSSVYTMIRHPGRDGARTMFEAIENAVALTENVTRMQNYRGITNAAQKAGRSAGDTAKLANQAARENSIDFLEMGSYGRVVNSFIPYFNAAIQGNRTLLRNIAEHPVSTSGKITALVGVPLAGSTIWNTSDPDRKAIYDTIPDYVKETNFIVITPGASWDADKKKWKGVIMMKKPPGVKEFAEPVRKFIEYKADNSGANLGDFLRDEGGSVAADFGQAMQPIDFSSPEKALSSMTPQLLKPTAEAILNRNFFQEGDIVPESMQDLAPEDQKYENYSQLTTHIAAMFNTSPLKVDHWIKQTFGEVGTNAQHYTDRVVLGAPEEAQGGRSLPESISRRFSSPSGGADTSAFWDTYNSSSSARKRASSQVTSLVKAGRVNEAKRKAEEYNETIGERFNDFMNQYSDSPNYDPEWDERINDLRIPTTDQAFKARARQK